MHRRASTDSVALMDTTVLHSQVQEPDVATIALRIDQLAKFRRIRGGLDTDAEFAKQIGVNPGQVSRVLKGTSAPGTRFIAGCLELFGIECFSDLFSVEPDDGDGAAA